MSEHKQDALDIQLHLLNAVRDSVSSQEYDTWFRDLNIDEIIGDARIVFSTTTKVKSEWLKARYTVMVKSLLQNITGVDYETFFVVRQSGIYSPNNAYGIKLSGFDWLFETENEEYNSIFKDYIKDSDELCKHNEYEQQKTLHEKRKQKADFTEADLNIPECVFCGSDDVPNVTLDIDLHHNIKQVISINVKIRAAKCSKCGEEYYDSETTELLRKIKNIIIDSGKES